MMMLKFIAADLQTHFQPVDDDTGHGKGKGKVRYGMADADDWRCSTNRRLHHSTRQGNHHNKTAALERRGAPMPLD